MKAESRIRNCILDRGKRDDCFLWLALLNLYFVCCIHLTSLSSDPNRMKETEYDLINLMMMIYCFTCIIVFGFRVEKYSCIKLSVTTVVI